MPSFQEGQDIDRSRYKKRKNPGRQPSLRHAVKCTYSFTLFPFLLAPQNVTFFRLPCCYRGSVHAAQLCQIQ